MKKNVLIILVFITYLCGNIFAQNGFIKGKVIDSKTKETLVGVSIITEAKTGTTTDVNGNYSLEIVPGDHTITFSFIGYSPQKVKLKIKTGEASIVNSSLDPDLHVLDMVVVSAGKFEQKLGDVTVSMEVLRPAQIENTNTTSIDQAISQMPGVTLLEDQPSIRGGSGYSWGAGSRVLLLVDDLPILTADAGDAKWNFVPVENIEQVEVIKGAASALFGSSALNGVINIRTAYPKNEPITRATIYNGIYMNPERKELKHWWGNTNPMISGSNFFHSRKIGNLDLVFGGNVFSDAGYRQDEKEQRVRANINTRYRSKSIEGLSFGLNSNAMYQNISQFFMWLNADSGAWQQRTGQVYPTIIKRMTLDPHITYFNKNGDRHIFRGRAFFIQNDVPDDSSKSNNANMYYAEYQFQKHMKRDLNWNFGLAGNYAETVAILYGNHYTNNVSLFAQLDKKFWKKLNLSLGVRGEYFRIDSTETESKLDYKLFGSRINLFFKPVFRAGLNYQLFKYTFLRTSYGQGYRFPTIAEKYIQADLGPLKVFPNHDLKPETGWSAEMGLKQGLKVSHWSGFLDVAGFWSEYNNMMEFTFGTWAPDSIKVPQNLFGVIAYYNKWAGFKSINIGNARITGIDVVLTGQGKILGLPAAILLGYTYTNPIDLNVDMSDSTRSTKSNILKYRFYHSAKADFELSYHEFSSGISFRYNSNMINIDDAFNKPLLPDQFNTSALPQSMIDKYSILPGLKEYREKHKYGDYVFDYRVSYEFTNTSKIAIIVRNLLNREYMGRPGDLQAPRTVTVQYVLNF